MYSEARRRAAGLDVRLERAFEPARRARAVGTEQLVRRLCDQYLRRLVEQSREERRRARRGLDWPVISRQVDDCGYYRRRRGYGDAVSKWFHRWRKDVSERVAEKLAPQ